MATPSGTMAGALHRNSAGITVLSIETILLASDFVSLGLRLWSRRLIKSNLQVNDILIIIAMIIVTVRYALEMTLVLKCGMGLPQKEVMRIGGSDVLFLFRKLIFASDLTWLTLVCLIKVSILHFYSRIFRRTMFVNVVYGVMCLVVAFYIAALFSDIFICIPPRKSWDPETPGRCGDSSVLYRALASTDTVIDVIIILLPMPMLWGLKLVTSKKVALTFIFGLGFIIIALTSVRIRFFSELDPFNITEPSRVALFSSLVPLLGIINANLPAMAPAFNKMFRSSIFSTAASKSGGSSGDRSNRFQKLSEPEIPLVDISGRW
ncbi:nucleoside-triphosphate phosphatase [Apiospora hydei]|uniref:Nucleoside-triphosphate phosphatase n=1 Tax=Apiospora hydei TaxID=1337664 RepID=A0ABR1WYZ9_9PEZI